MTLADDASGPATAGHPATPIGLAALAKMAFDGADMNPLEATLIERMVFAPGDAAALMDLATIEQLRGNRDDGLWLQAQALERERLYRRPPPVAGADAIRLLAFMAPGDFMANTPLEFLLDGSDVSLDMLYVVPGQPLPETIPEHDLAFVAVGESDENLAVLREVAVLTRSWAKPVLNSAERITRLSRDGAWALLNSTPGVAIPTTARIDRQGLLGIGTGDVPVAAVLPGETFPIIARPLGSHAGEGLARLDDRAAAATYLRDRPERQFFIAPFIDYRGPDGLYRKYRLALIDGRPFACHMAISQHWMIHYLNAGMREDAGKRGEEARHIAEFDHDFALRHEAALRAIAERVGLDYVAMDCGETPDGRLLLFEVDVAMIVHAMDPSDLFPYKQPQMRKVFDAFRAMLRRAGAGPGATAAA